MAALQENTLRVAPCKSTDEHVLFVAVVCYFLDKDRSYNTALFRAFVVSPLLVAGGLIAAEIWPYQREEPGQCASRFFPPH